MSKKEISNSEKRRIEIQKDPVKNKDVYSFPLEGVSVKANSLEEAHLELEKLLKPKDKKND